jgi:hypothetical protein
MSGLPKKAQDRVNTFGILLIGLVTTVLLWVSVVALQAYYYSSAGEIEREREAHNKGRQARDLKARQTAELMDSKYVDPQRGLVTIPIDTAKDMVLREARGRADSLVPAIGAHDTPTVPAVWGRPSDTATAPKAGTVEEGDGEGADEEAPPAGDDSAALDDASASPDGEELLEPAPEVPDEP